MKEVQIKRTEERCYELYKEVKGWTKKDKKDFVEWANDSISYYSNELRIASDSLYILRKLYEAYLYAIEGKEYTFNE